ncbi:MAG: tetratricopeptide repeat protein [Desulfovibrionaceae bacterium]
MAKNRVQLEPVMRRNSAILLAVATFLGGLFLGFNISFFLNSEKQTVSPVVSIAPVQPQAAQSVAGGMDALLARAEANPSDPHAWIDLGNAYFDAGKAAEAIPAYEKALALNPDHPDVWTDLGVMYRRAGQPQKAVESFDRALLAQPSHQTARFNKGIVLYYDLKDAAGALQSWELLLQGNPGATAPDGTPIRTMVDKLKAGQPL